MVLGGYHDLLEAQYVKFGGNTELTLPKPANLPETKQNIVATFVDGHVVACGGRGRRDCFSYDLEQNTWVKTASFDRERRGAMSFMSSEGEWHILGGHTDDDYTKSTVIYKDGILRPGKDLLHSSWYHCVVKVNDTHVFMCGGSNSNPPVRLPTC